MIFVSHNRGKFEEIDELFKLNNLSLQWKNVEYEEIQAESTEEISRRSCETLTSMISEDFFIEDTGLYIKSLKGFPGPYSSYVVTKIGLPGILKLLENRERDAYFLTVVSLRIHGNIIQFSGKSSGHISFEEKGKNGFGYDPIFIPEGSELTLSEMTVAEKNAVSHRAIAINKMIDYLTGL